MHVNSKNRASRLPFALRLIEFASRVLPQQLKKIMHSLPLLRKLIQSQLASSTPGGLTEVVVRNGILRGIRLKLDLKRESSYWLGGYEDQLIQAISDFCKPGMIVYDIGADIGCISIAFARITGKEGKVYTFESLPENVQRLNEHITLNSLQGIIHLVPYAVSDYEGKELFLVYQKHILGRLDGLPYIYRINNHINKIKVNSLRLDDFIYRDGNPPANLIKMDIEGGGVKAIPGMLRVLSEARPLLFMELHGPEEQQIAWNALKKNKYSIYLMQKGYPKISSLDLLAQERDYIVAIP